MVVDQTNKAGMRPVKMGERFGALGEVVEGLKAGDRVIVQGMQKTPPGAPVIVKEWTPTAAQVASIVSAERKEP
jgi:membrane fusion protein (multidrug efflux system)